MTKYPNKFRLKHQKSFSVYLLSVGLGLALSVSAPHVFAKSKTASKATNNSAHKTVKLETIKASKKITKTQVVNNKSSKEKPALKTATSKIKQKISPIQLAKVKTGHGHKKAQHHSVLFAKAKHKESQHESTEITLAPEATEINERIHSLIAPQNNELILSQTPINNQINGPITSVHGVIDQSLTESATNVGLSNELIEQLTSIFAWDIDFANNLDQGDKFTLVYAQEPESTEAQIVAAEFTNRGRILTALRYTTPDGTVNYFSPEGKPMRKSFLSAPLDYLKISSGFSSHRKHPILNRIRAHKGVDYAARTGTPVKSAGDGEVVFAGNKGGYGQMLIVKHGDHYETVYAHLSDFKDGLETGDSVKQGEVIGYVGQTGLATGPHLHYEFRVDGEHRNPEALNTAQASPLHDDILADFKDQTKAHLNQLNKTKAQSLLARN